VFPTDKSGVGCAQLSCSQFLWINLCGTGRFHLKLLIPLGKLKRLKMKQSCAASNYSSANNVSAHFLWTKLCASERGNIQGIDFKEKSY
jgi:hypothetical protein